MNQRRNFQTTKCGVIQEEDTWRQCRGALPGSEKSRVSAAVLPIAEGLWGQFCLTALTIIFKMLLVTYHCDDRLAMQVGSEKAKQKRHILTQGHEQP